MTKLLPISAKTKYYIWAYSALLGSDLEQAENVLLEINRGQIMSVRICPFGLLPAFVRASPRFLCLEQGQTLMPSLIDAHVHLALDGQRKGLEVPSTRVKNDLDKMIAAGIGFVRDGGDSRAFNSEIKMQVEKGLIRGPVIVSTGSAVRHENGYGSFLGQGYTATSEIPDFVKRVLQSGADQLKVVISGVVSYSHFGRVSGPLLPPEALTTIVTHAKLSNLKVMAHASSVAAVKMAVDAGVNSIEHGYFITADLLSQMAEKKIAWVPTVIPVAVRCRKPFSGEHSRKQLDVIKRTCEEHLEKLELAHRLGVRLGMGTDSGAPGVRHGSGLHEEIELYGFGSMSNQAILKAVTVVNAHIIGCSGEAGRIEVGMKPYLIAVSGDPIKNPAALKDIAVYIWPHNGCAAELTGRQQAAK